MLSADCIKQEPFTVPAAPAPAPTTSRLWKKWVFRSLLSNHHVEQLIFRRWCCLRRLARLGRRFCRVEGRVEPGPARQQFLSAPASKGAGPGRIAGESFFEPLELLLLSAGLRQALEKVVSAASALAPACHWTFLAVTGAWVLFNGPLLSCTAHPHPNPLPGQGEGIQTAAKMYKLHSQASSP